MLFALLRSAIRGTKLTEEERSSYDPEQLPELLKMSAKHDVDHLVVLGLKQNDLITKENAEIERHILLAVYRYEQIRYAYDNLCAALEKAQIPFIPLKGAVIRKYYPEAWMRTSCDIDVLVREGDLEKAKTVLVNDYGYADHGKGSHDISLYTPNNIHIELHYTLVEDGGPVVWRTILKDVWESSAVLEGKTYQHLMTDAMFCFYHVAHMARHFESGGCGIRPFIDLWIIDGIDGADAVRREDLLANGNLHRFADVALQLGRVWFSGAEHTETTKQMEQYILRGGVYGNNENRIAVQQQKKGGRMKYALSKIFISYDEIKFHYPILQEHKWLTPVMEIRRWFKLVFCGHAKRTLNELKYSQMIPADKGAATKKFLEDIGLQTGGSTL